MLNWFIVIDWNMLKFEFEIWQNTKHLIEILGYRDIKMNASPLSRYKQSHL